MDNLAKEIEKIVRESSNILLNSNKDKEIEQKEGIGNLVTKYDKQVQKYLKERLLNLIPDALFIGEEEENNNKILEKGYTFIVDPIDGTMNFTRNLNLSAISVALLKDNELYIGVCYNPYSDEMYVAIKNKGAYLDNKRIKVSNRKLDEAIVIVGNAPYYSELREKSLTIGKKLLEKSNDYRRLGSAVIDLCSIACGKAEVYYELRIQPWDCAAGILIVTESGGIVTTIDGKKIDLNKPTSILATNNMEDYLKYLDI